MNKASAITVFVNLLDEDVDVMRSTQAINLGNGQYKLLPIPNFAEADETWEFEPGSIVRLKRIKATDGEMIWLAVSL